MKEFKKLKDEYNNVNKTKADKKIFIKKGQFGNPLLKTKIKNKIKLPIMLVLVVCLAVFAMCLNRDELDNIYKNIQELQKQYSKLLSIAEDETTVIDLTSISTGEDVSHKCLFEQKYDDNYHWKQCSICGKIENNEKKTHNKKISGENNCSSTAPNQIEYCSEGCGYNKTLPKKAHTYEGDWKQSGSGMHYKTCTVCRTKCRRKMYR